MTVVRRPSPGSVSVNCKSIIDLYGVVFSIRFMEKTLEFFGSFAAKDYFSVFVPNT